MKKEEWKDITRKCEFKLKADNEGTYFLGIYHNKKEIGSALNVSYILGINALLQDDYKIVSDCGDEGRILKKANNFKILKRVR